MQCEYREPLRSAAGLSITNIINQLGHAGGHVGVTH